MITFDQSLSVVVDWIKSDLYNRLDHYLPIIINRDLNGRIKLVADEKYEKDLSHLIKLAKPLHEKLKPLTSIKVENFWMFESLWDSNRGQWLTEDWEPYIQLGAFRGIYVVDRLIEESSWITFSPKVRHKNSLRIVFHSMNGDDQFNAMMACGFVFASKGLKVMVLDMNLQSPSFSPRSSFPKFGIVDWLVEDLTNNEKEVESDISVVDCNLRIVPAHGKNSSNYLNKLGRIFMPKAKEPWYQRLTRLIKILERKYRPNLVLVNSSCGMNEISNTCLTCLGANSIYLFGDGYNLLFNHWEQHGKLHTALKNIQRVYSSGKYYASRSQLHVCNVDIHKLSKTKKEVIEILYQDLINDIDSTLYHKSTIDDDLKNKLGHGPDLCAIPETLSLIKTL